MTSFLLKFNSNGCEILMLSISKAFASLFAVEKKNIVSNRNKKNIYKNFEWIIILLRFMPHNKWIRDYLHIKKAVWI